MLYRFSTFLSYCILKIFFKLEVQGKDQFPAGKPFILASNHISNLDPPVLAVACPYRISFLAKEELFEGRAASFYLRGVGAFPLKRGRADVKAIRLCLKILQTRALLLFPQGTRGFDFDKVSPGVGFLCKKAKIPVIAAKVCGTDKILPRGSKALNKGRVGVIFKRVDDINDSDTYEEITEKVINKGISVIIEKPLTLNLPWTDYNNNGVLDEGEEGRGGKPMRGEDQNGNGIIDVPPDRYYDLNGNLQRETGDCPSIYPDPDDSTITEDIELRSRIYKQCDYAEPFIGFQAIYYPDDSTRINRYEPVFVDYTKDGFWNKSEPCFDDNNDGLCQVYGDTDSLGFQLYEFNFEGGKVTNEAPLPYGKGGGVVDVVETVDGKAVQKVTYPQSDAVKIQVRISAEANGVKDFIKIRLPIIEDN